MQIRTDTDLGLVIRARRQELGLDQASLAERAGVSRQWIVEVEGGKPRAEVALVLRTLRALGLEVRTSTAGAPSAESDGPSRLIDIDAVIDGARRSDDA